MDNTSLGRCVPWTMRPHHIHSLPGGAKAMLGQVRVRTEEFGGQAYLM
jgi:hypothetical protein